MSREEIKALAATLLNDLISESIHSAAVTAARDIKRSRVLCSICGTHCRTHNPTIPPPPANPAPVPSSASASSQAPSPVSTSHNSAEGRTGGYGAGPERGTGGSTGVGSGSGKMDGNGNAFFDCLVCQRATASNRYAPHLATCLGLGGSTRRGAARTAAVKARMSTSDRSSPAPILNGSENGDSDNESTSGKKGKKGVLNGNAKKKASPSKNILKKTKSYPSSASSTPAPSFRNSLGPGPSRLGRPPKNASNASPAISPANTIISLPGSTGSSRNGVGEKRPPPGADAPSAIMVDDDDMDDY